MKKIVILVLLLLLAGFSAFTYLTVKKQNLIKNGSANPAKKVYKSHISCSDIREVLDREGRYYIACYGGVLVVDKNSGQIVSQITMAEGLGDFVTTGLVKKGNTLYIGTQDGLTIWDLYTNTGRKLSVAEGLPNGANILLREDGKYIWIGTFDGLARLNTETNQLETFRSELLPYEGEKLNVSGIAVTNNYAYFSVVASIHSSGFIARYNKASSAWEKFDTSSFGDNSQYARVDAFGLCSADNGIFFTKDKSLWKIADDETTKPSKIFTAGFNDIVDWNIFCSGNSVLFKTSKNTLIYENGKVRPVDNSTDGNLLAAYKTREDYKNFNRLLGSNNPGTFYQLMGVIDDNVYLDTYNGYWVYNTSTDKFTQIVTPDKPVNGSSEGSMFAWPVAKTNKFVIFGQVCGMGCDKPKFYVCTYPNNSCETLNLPQEVLTTIAPSETAIGQDFGYFNLLSDYETDTEKMVFKVSYNNKPYKITLGAKDLQWTVEKSQSADTSNTASSPESCTSVNSYRFTNNVLAVDKTYCVGKNLETLVGGYYYKFNENRDVVRVDKRTNELYNLSPKMAKPKYVPFDDPGWNKPTLNKIVSYGEQVYFATDRGLWILDTTKEVLQPYAWTLISTDDGLPSNDIQNFAYVGNKLFVLTTAGIALIGK